MNKNIRLLVEGFFDDDIFNVKDDIKSDIEDLSKYYEYHVGDIYYLNKKPYAICCGEHKQFNDNKPRFCLLKNSKKLLTWRTQNILVKDLERFGFKDFYLNSFNDFQHIDEDGYGNTQIIKNNYDISEFPAFEYCLNLNDNIYLPAIDELQIMYLNKDKLGKYELSKQFYWSSTQYSDTRACSIDTYYSDVSTQRKRFIFHVRPFFHIY